MLDFWLPMLLLFATATLGAVAARRKRDRCLKYFNRKPVLIEMSTGKWMWGRFTVYPKTLELIFEHPQSVVNGMAKASYVLYAPEIEGIKKILHPPPVAGTEAFEQWQKEVDRVAHPSVARRATRWVWNLFNTLRDAVSQAFSMLIGTLKTKTAVGKIVGADKHATQVGNTLIEAVPNAYEPVLERYRNRWVVVEIVEEGSVVEFTGLLQEYSAKYFLLRNVAYSPKLDASIALGARYDLIFPRDKALVRHFLQPV